MLLLGSRNALGRAKCYKTGEKSIFGALPGGRPSGGPSGLPATLRRRVGRPLSEGGPEPELSGIIQGSRIQNMLPLSCGSAFLGLPKARICFPWAVEMPELLARQNTEKQGKKRKFILKRVEVCAGGGGGGGARGF